MSSSTVPAPRRHQHRSSPLMTPHPTPDLARLPAWEAHEADDCRWLGHRWSREETSGASPRHLAGSSASSRARAHQQMKTLPTASSWLVPPPPDLGAILTPRPWHQDQRCSSSTVAHPRPPSSVHVALKMSFSSTLTPGRPERAVGLPWERCGGKRGVVMDVCLRP